jgi:HK97 gp10 family phage protein
MVTLTVKIDGLEKLTAAIRKEPIMAKIKMNEAVRRSVGEIQNTAIKEAPVNKQTGGGNLRQNIRSRMTGELSGVIESRAGYSLFVHEGTAPHLIRPVNARALANVRTGQFFGKLVHHPGTKPNPFFRRAIQRSKVAVEKIWNDAIGAILKTMAQ